MAALDAAAPEVLVNGPDLVGGHGDGDIFFLGVLDLLGARVGVFAHRGDDGRVRHQGAHDILDAELVVALAGAAVAEGVRADLLGDLDGLQADQGPGDGGGERVALVVAVGLDGGPAVVGDELGLGVGGVVFAAERLGAVLGAFDVLGGLADIHGDGDDALEPVVLAHHRDADGGVQAPGVNNDDGFRHVQIPLIECDKLSGRNRARRR